MQPRNEANVHGDTSSKFQTHSQIQGIGNETRYSDNLPSTVVPSAQPTEYVRVNVVMEDWKPQDHEFEI